MKLPLGQARKLRGHVKSLGLNAEQSLKSGLPIFGSNFVIVQS